jgi:hypothetical protein
VNNLGRVDKYKDLLEDIKKGKVLMDDQVEKKEKNKFRK